MIPLQVFPIEFMTVELGPCHESSGSDLFGAKPMILSRTSITEGFSEGEELSLVEPDAGRHAAVLIPANLAAGSQNPHSRQDTQHEDRRRSRPPYTIFGVSSRNC